MDKNRGTTTVKERKMPWRRAMLSTQEAVWTTTKSTTITAFLDSITMIQVALLQEMVMVELANERWGLIRDM